MGFGRCAKKIVLAAFLIVIHQTIPLPITFTFFSAHFQYHFLIAQWTRPGYVKHQRQIRYKMSENLKSK